MIIEICIANKYTRQQKQLIGDIGESFSSRKSKLANWNWSQMLSER